MKRKSHFPLWQIITLAAFVSLASLCAPGQTGDKPRLVIDPPPAGDITGYYTCAGVESSGKKYGGICTIQRKADIYIVNWAISDNAFTGIGVRQGETFAVGWAMPGPNGVVIRGVNIYRVEKGPRLVGRWATLPGNGAVQSESLEFLKALPPADGDGDTKE